MRIGELVASILPEAPTLQFGPGGVSEGIAKALDRPVHIWSGLVTDEMAALHGRGLLLGPVVAAYAWGGEPIRALAAAGMLRLRSSTVTHDLSRLSATPRFVGCNTALQVGLDGSVNVERIGRRTIAAVGGHADFCVGASRSVGGLSIIALRSVAGNGSSAIVPEVDVVSTGRSDIQVVVTEHGIADLRKVGDDERARRLIGIAAPEHRADLRTATTGSTHPEPRCARGRSESLCQPLTRSTTSCAQATNASTSPPPGSTISSWGLSWWSARWSASTRSRSDGPAGTNASARCFSVAALWLVSG